MAELVECLHGVKKVLGLIFSSVQSPLSQNSGLEIQDHPKLLSESEVRLGYIRSDMKIEMGKGSSNMVDQV